MDQTGFDIPAQSTNPSPCLWVHLCSLSHSSFPFAGCSYMRSMLPCICAHVRLSNPTYSACLDLPMHLRLNTAGYIWTRMRVSVQNTPPHLYAYTQTCWAQTLPVRCLWQIKPLRLTCHLTSQQGMRRLVCLWMKQHPHLRVQFSCTALARVVHWPSHSTDINNPCWVRGLQWPQTLSGIQAADTLRQYPALPS